MSRIPLPDEVKTIAVRLSNWVGDGVMNTPFLGELRKLFPDARIVGMGRRGVATILEHHPGIDEIWPIDDRTRSGFFAAARRLRALRADLGFVLPNSLKTAGLLYAGRVRHRVGFNRDARGFLLNHAVALRPEDLALHETRYYLRLLGFWQPAIVGDIRMRLAVTEQEEHEFDEWLERKGIARDAFLVGLNPGAAQALAKRWLPSRFAEVGRHFVRTRNAVVMVNGVPDEADVVGEVCCLGGSGFIDLSRDFTLRQLMVFLKRCHVLISNDTGPMHMAAALGTPVVAVFGSTDWMVTSPWSRDARVVRVETPCAPCHLRICPIDHRCMTGVEAGAVIAAAEELLSWSGTRKAAVAPCLVQDSEGATNSMAQPPV